MKPASKKDRLVNKKFTGKIYFRSHRTEISVAHTVSPLCAELSGRHTLSPVCTDLSVVAHALSPLRSPFIR